MAEEHQQHIVECNKVCAFHEGNTSRLSGMEGAAKATLAITGAVLFVVVMVVVFVFRSQANDIKDVHDRQDKHEEVVSKKMDEAVKVVRDMKWNLSSRMISIEHRQKEIEGSNQQIQKSNEEMLRYLKLLLDHVNTQNGGVPKGHEVE